MMKTLVPSDTKHGKLFPIWMIKNFHEFVLEKESEAEDEDPCKTNQKGSQKQLHPYQRLLAKYLSLPPFRGLLVYHGLGSGKTAGAIHLISTLNREKVEYNVVVLLPAALQTGWSRELKEWNVDKYDIHFVSTNASNLNSQFMDVIKRSDTSKKMLYIIDEAHSFISNVRTNLLEGTRRAASVYEYIQKDIANQPGTKILLLSGTPIRGDVYEVCLLFNLLRPGALPKSEALFTTTFLEDTEIPRLNPKRKLLFQRRIAGLVSYFRGTSSRLYARRDVVFLNLTMEPRQEDTYSVFKSIEKKSEALALRKNRRSTQSFKTATRLCSNFVSPVKGGRRPRPSQFRLDVADVERIMMGKKVAEDENKSVQMYVQACRDFMKATEKYFADAASKSRPLKDDLERFREQEDGDFVRFRNREGHTAIFEEIVASSIKMTAAVFLTFISPGPVVIYSNFVMMEGIDTLKIYLNLAEISFVEFHGQVDKNLRQKNLELFNQGKAKVMLVSAAGSEGINLKNVRTVIILEPAWSEDVIQQVIGRAIRQCSHKDLPPSERVVRIYRMKAMEKERSTDEYIEDHAFRKHAQKQSFLDAMKEAAIDCNLFAGVNEVQCPLLPSSELLKDPPGPTLQKDVALDAEKKDTYHVKKLKVRKIKGIVRPSPKVMNFLFDEQTGVVYDPNYHLPVGRVNKDLKGFFEKESFDVYIISDYLPDKI